MNFTVLFFSCILVFFCIMIYISKYTMKKMKRSWIAVVVMLCLVIAAQTGGTEPSSAKTVKEITVAKIKGDTLSYHKAVNNMTIMKDPQWENIVGYGKKKTIKMAKDTKFYLFNPDTMKPYKE